MKGYSAFPKASGLLKPDDHMLYPEQSFGQSYPFTMMESVYSTAPADSAVWVRSRTGCVIWALVRLPVEEKENSKFKPAASSVKIGLVSHLACGLGLGLIYTYV